MSVIKALHNISSDVGLSFDEKLIRLLTLGTKVLGLEWGIVSHIQGNKYRVVQAVTPESNVHKNDEFVASETYCIDAFKADDIIAYPNINEHPGASHPCYSQFPLRSYFSTALHVNGERYGTLNFSSVSVREQPFTDLECDYLLLLAEWIGIELARRESLENIQVQQVKLTEQNMLLKQITELAGVGTWELDVKTQRLTWAESLKKMIGLPSSTVVTIDTVLSIIKHDEERKAYEQRFKDIIKSGVDGAYEMEIVTFNGETKWVESLAHPIVENGKTIKVIGATQDITERVFNNISLRQKTEIAEKALQARSLFLANMSHEIRTPIHGVQGMIETLLNTSLNESQRKFANVAMRSAKSLLEIVNDILDFSKIDAGQMSYESVPVCLTDVVKAQVPMFEKLAKDKGLDLIVDADAAENVHFSADPLRLSQILINLLNNAIKFTPKGRVKLAVRCKPLNGGNYRVKIIVSDTGIGISEAQQRVIFMPFLQAEDNTSRKFGGTGLGLAIVTKIVEHYHGKIELSSALGEGTRFVVNLLLDSANQARTRIDHSSDSFSHHFDEERLKNSRILVVEDNDINQIVIREQLKELGASADIASNGEEGVEQVKMAIAKRKPYDLILMDCQMPVMDGITATRHIREMGIAGTRVVIVALTANAFAGERDKCLNAGMDDFITKPVGAEALGRCIRYHLMKSQAV
ncbi:ATP-binding protein [Alteromonas sp. KUL49]|uniref:GAF domain-containing hybrid sensor histidine kinase/response regulator n=1 Tax=Alteromonas sp. KUL49 TaxID=2480798 RepID=UPI00102F14CF|nr:ATP-binding protein [Alteromonas sp. KUL49]TAP37916.1 response regulator [Alteromonas sp. KUL49]GEA12777.1 hypothetical protein KUL49_31520 [Alteromonas sp. KUL49]